ncbi:NADP-dependent phosphogluconate dehydrogenase [Candidatus Parcubacteria bacterium]|nr:NADP-dependent phosphogluconate dehydrogenase [Candidatus Parcubacteria bacterium]
MKLGFIGLGKMGGRMSEKLLNEGHVIVGLDLSEGAREALKAKFPDSKKLRLADSLRDLISDLPAPRVVYLMLPAGDPTEKTLEQLANALEADDIVIDGGNSKFDDTDRHAKKFAGKNIRFLGIGISGGIISAYQGYPLMVGGDRSAYEHINPVLESLAKPNGGHEYFGPGGAGHFVKMVHNGIEYPFMQALGEGFGVMDNSPYGLDLLKVAKLYQKGTLVSGFMLDRVVEALEDDTVSQVEGVIGSASGEAVWTVDEAKKNNLPAESIEQSIDFRKRSINDPWVQKSFAARMVGALRIKFGGHPVKKKTD